MKRRNACLRLLLLGTVAGLALLWGRGATVVAAGNASTEPAPRVLIVRGVFNVFSLGMDDLACKLAQRGYRVDVAPPSLALLAARTIEQEYLRESSPRSLVIIGHSLGGRFCCSIPWRWRESGIQVRLVVILDANPQMPVPDNVQRCVNLYATNAWGVFHGRDVWAVDARTELINLDMTKVRRPLEVPPIDHFNIDDSPWIQSLVMEEVEHAVGVVPHRSVRPGGSIRNRPRVWTEPGEMASGEPARLWRGDPAVRVVDRPATERAR